MKVIITGAAGGIGAGVAFQLAKGGGAALMLVDRDAARLEATAGQARALGAKVETLTADLGDVDAPADIVAKTVQAFGGLDGIVSNAGVLVGGALKDLTVENYELSFAINTRPTWLLGKAAHPHLAKSKGAIVATASLSAENATPPLGTYSASKAALVMLMKQMAVEWGKDGIRCNCVSPGPTLTPMTEKGYADPERKKQREQTIALGRLGAPEDIANAIVFLLGPNASFITGVNLFVDGGINEMLMPASGAGRGQT